MSGGGEGVLFSESVRKTLQSIREITGKEHSDEEIYAVLKGCSMDPNDTAQKLLHIDTFHEVKKKRDKKKETPAPQGQRSKGRREKSSKYSNSEASDGRNAIPRWENGAHAKEGGHSLPRQTSRSIFSVAKASNLPNRNSSHAHDFPLLERHVKVTKDGSNVDMKKLDNGSKPPVYSGLTASDPILASFRQPGALNENEKSGLNNVNGEKPKEAAVAEEIVEKDSSGSLEPASVRRNGCSSNYDNAMSGEDAEIIQNTTTLLDGLVIFPDQFKVSEALKSGLTFGGVGADNSYNEIGAARVSSSSSNHNESLTVEVDQPVRSESPQHQPEEVDEKGDQCSAVGDQSQQEALFLVEANQNQMVDDDPNSGVGIMPTVQGVHPVEYEEHDYQALDSRPSRLSSEKSVIFSPSPTPTVQNNVAASPQMVYWPPYSPNYIPYGYYYPYSYPPMHQFLSHRWYPQQPLTGNAYLASAAGVKYGRGQFKPRAATGGNFMPIRATGGNFMPIRYTPVYGSYNTSPVAFYPRHAAASGPSGNEDPTASQLNESQMYNTEPMNEVSAWNPPGLDISSVPPNSLYYGPSPGGPGQHLTMTPAQYGHGPFPRIYHPIIASSAVNPFVQQSQEVSAADEDVDENAAAPSSAYQQP